MYRSALVALSLALFLCPLSPALAQNKKAEATRKLLAASAEGDQDAILAAIAAGADVNARDDDKNTPLMLMASQSLFGKERQVVEALVKAKVRVDETGLDGATALMIAASAGRDGMLRLLLANGAKVDRADDDGWTPLMYASAAGQWSVVKELIDAKANVNAVEKKGWTPLALAIMNGRGAVAERLIAAGATMPSGSPTGLTTIMMAAYGRDLATVRHVLAANLPLDGVDDDGWTALELAAAYGDKQIVMELLRAGADPSIKDKEGKTALDRALTLEDPEVAALLGGPWKKPALKGGTSINVPCQALGGNVLAHFAVTGGDLVVTTVFPRPVTWYLGGGNTNRAESAKKHTYEGSFTPTYYLDIDSNPKTGSKEAFFPESLGSEYSIDYSQYGTSVMLAYEDSRGNPRTKQVYANVLDVDIEKEGSAVDTSELEEPPRAINDGGVLVTRVPLSLLSLKSGKTIRTTAKIGSCKAEGKVKL